LVEKWGGGEVTGETYERVAVLEDEIYVERE